MKRIAFALALVACATKLPEPTIEEKRTAAGVKFTTELLACVDDAGSPDASDACAAGVRARWDGGAR